MRARSVGGVLLGGLWVAVLAGAAVPAEKAEVGNRYRTQPNLPRSGEPAVIAARLKRTIQLLNEAIQMQAEPRTQDNVARSDGVLYAAYKYLGAAANGVEIRIDKLARARKIAIRDPLLDLALRTLEQARGGPMRAAMNANKGADAEATADQARATIALIEHALAMGF